MTSERPRDDAHTAEEERLLEQLSALLDGELDADERAAAEAWIASDEAARAAFEDLRLIRTALASLEPVPAPRSFALAAPAVAAPRRTIFARFDFLLRIGSAAAALLFVVSMAGGGSMQTATMPAAETLASGSAEAPVDTVTLGEFSEESANDGAEAEGDTAASPELAPPSDSASDGRVDEPAPGAGAPEPSTGVGGGDTGSDSGSSPAFEPAPADENARDADFRVDDESIGGTTAALGALAVMLAALSALFTWQRRA
jgi:hypothetical protein